MRTFWNRSDEEKLKYLYEEKGLSLSELNPLFERTKDAIQNKISKLKLRHTDKQTFSIKSRLNCGKNNGMYGKASPNKGKTKENSERIKRAGIKLSQTRKMLIKQGKIKGMNGSKNPQFGKHSWSFGLTKFSNEKLKKAAEKQSLTKKDKWNKLSEDKKNVIRKIMAHIGANCKKRKTSIEIIIAGLLDSFKIGYEWGYEKDGFVFDFFLKDFNLVIECQGDYWHANPMKYSEKNINNIQKRNIKRDHKKINYLLDKKISCLFFWEYDIKHKIDEIKRKIYEISSNKNNKTT